MEEDLKNIKTKKADFFSELETFVTTFVVVILIFVFIISTSGVKQFSMFPTLREGEGVLIYQFMYKPKFKDIIISTQPNFVDHILVKRVIATEGQTVNIDPVAHKVFVDGKELNEQYILEPIADAGDIKYPITIPKNKVFAMGDNRNGSMDSRDSRIGLIDKRYIKGKVIFRFWPFNKFGVVK